MGIVCRAATKQGTATQEQRMPFYTDEIITHLLIQRARATILHSNQSEREEKHPMAKKEQVELLKRSVPEWNQWRKEHPDIGPDLSSADLSSANLSSANLNSADLSRPN